MTSSSAASVTGHAATVRVSVVSGVRRVDLSLPGAVPVAELIPELARSVGLLHPGTAAGGFRLVTAAGRVLAPELGLAGQGVEDGGLLAVAAGGEDPAPRRYDDLAEAVADAAERDLRPWGPAARRRTTLAVASLLVLLGAAALLVQRGSASATAAGTAVLLVGAAAALSRTGAGDAAVVAAWLGCVHGAVAGLLVADGPPLATAGAGALAAGLPALVGVRAARVRVLPPVLVAAVALAAGLVVHVAGADVRVVLTTALVLVVLAGGGLPGLTLTLVGPRVDPPARHVDLAAAVAPLDPARIRADARVAHEMLVALTATVGLLLVAVAPLAVGLGAAGTALAVVASGVVLLRTRPHRSGAVVLVGLGSGVLGLVVVAGCVLARWPDGRLVTALVLVAAGVLTLALGLRPGPAPVRWSRAGDLLETAGLVALPPLLVAATGLVPGLGG